MGRRDKAAKSEGDFSMSEDSAPLLPCYGGPKDGKFFPEGTWVAGYKTFEVRGRKVFLFRDLKVERIDFNTLARASKMLPPEKE